MKEENEKTQQCQSLLFQEENHREQRESKRKINETDEYNIKTMKKKKRAVIMQSRSWRGNYFTP